jgi:transcriptional regulator with XRE-family HTH domain
VYKLKFFRVQSGMTLEQLAADSGLTRSYLSKVERGLSAPSIGAAMTIAAALGVSVEQLFGQPDGDQVSIVRARKGQAGDPKTFLSLLTTGDTKRAMRAFIVRPVRAPGSRPIMSHHRGEEIVFVLSGKIEMRLGKRKEILNPGDCVQFDSTLPHKLVALTSEPAAALVVVATTD